MCTLPSQARHFPCSFPPCAVRGSPGKAGHGAAEAHSAVPAFCTGGERSPAFLGKWMKANKGWLMEQMTLFGAVKFTGFDVAQPMDVQTALVQFDELSDEYRGTSPRVVQGDTQYVFSASELPGFFPIPQHLEMSFLNGPPARLYFSCLDDSFTANTAVGGETCLCDFRKVWAQLDPALKAKMKDQGVLYVRNYLKRTPAVPVDVFKLKPWTDLFMTDDPAEVDAECAATGLSVAWGDGDSLSIANAAGATRVHPETNVEVFSNHAPTFHIAMGAQEFDRTWRRTGELRLLVLWALMGFLTALYRLIMPWTSYGMHTTLGSGQQLSDEEMEHVRDVIWANMVFPRWRKGDILMIDNWSVSHGRQPYIGKRKVVVSWAAETQGAAPLPPHAVQALHPVARAGSGAGATAAMVRDYSAYFRYAHDYDDEVHVRDSSYETMAHAADATPPSKPLRSRARSAGRRA